MGINAEKVKAGLHKGNNYGFDDDKSEYLVKKNDHVIYRYEVAHRLGKGSFGQVFMCIDHKTANRVAVKIIKNKPKYHRQGLVEVPTIYIYIYIYIFY